MRGLGSPMTVCYRPRSVAEGNLKCPFGSKAHLTARGGRKTLDVGDTFELELANY